MNNFQVVWNWLKVRQAVCDISAQLGLMASRESLSPKEVFEITLPDQTVGDLALMLPHHGSEAEFCETAIDVGRRQKRYPAPSYSELRDASS